MVGEDGRFVPFGCAADDHMQHPVRGLDVMFLRDKNTSTRSHTCGGSSHRRPPVAAAGASHARLERETLCEKNSGTPVGSRKRGAFTILPGFLSTFTSKDRFKHACLPFTANLWSIVAI